MTRIAHKNYRRQVFAFSDFGTMRFLRRRNPIPLPTSPLKGEELKGSLLARGAKHLRSAKGEELRGFPFEGEGVKKVPPERERE